MATPPKKGSMSKKILEEKLGKETAVIMLLNGKNEEGKEGYVYIAVRTDNFKNFQKAYSGGPVRLEDYGVILASGEGQPSDEVKKKMTEEYNFNHEEAVPVPMVKDGEA